MKSVQSAVEHAERWRERPSAAALRAIAADSGEIATLRLYRSSERRVARHLRAIAERRDQRSELRALLRVETRLARANVIIGLQAIPVCFEDEAGVGDAVEAERVRSRPHGDLAEYPVDPLDLVGGEGSTRQRAGDSRRRIHKR